VALRRCTVLNFFRRIGRPLGVVAVVLVAGSSAAWMAAGTTRAPAPPAADEKKDADQPAKLRRVGPDAVLVPPEVQASLGIKTAAATAPTRKRKLPAFQGTLNFDLNRLARIQTTLPGPIIELGTIPEPIPTALPGMTPVTAPRPLKPGDRVKKGDVLAVVWSKDLGEKKSEYVAALATLKTDEETLKNLQYLYEMSGGTAERTVRQAELTVKADRVAVERAEATLRGWRLSDEEIAALRADAVWLSVPDIHFFFFTLPKRTDPGKWARFEVKAPRDGEILEKNVLYVGQVVDTTADLFRIGDLSLLEVWVHLYDEDLPLLRDLSLPTPWVVAVASRPGATFTGRMERVAASIDWNQRTALVTGTVENRNGELRAGMPVTVTVELPPPAGEVEVPAEAVVEDGRESAVFVRPDPAGSQFVRRAVTVKRRSRDVIAIAAEPGGVKPGDLVVTAGSLLLSDAVNDLPRPKP
jgi:membrane fusion protein, heavy metal efflux system